MAWVFVPGYGIWPRKMFRPPGSARIIGQASPDFMGSQTGLGAANPASVHCVKRGGKLTIKKDRSGGEYGVCRLPSGRSVEEWALFREEGMSGAPSFTVEDDRPAIRFPDMSPEGVDVHRRMSDARASLPPSGRSSPLLHWRK